jgi:hypothetical protein
VSYRIWHCLNLARVVVDVEPEDREAFEGYAAADLLVRALFWWASA